MTNIRRNIRRNVTGIVVGALVAAACGGATTTASSPSASIAALVDIGLGVKGPADLRATVYARGLKNAAAFAFDAQQRLWVATAAYTDAGKDGVYVVGKAGATPVEVISGLRTPLGLLWYHDSLYVASKERVDAYSDLRADRFTSHRTIVSFPAGVGELNSLVLAPDGRMLLGISAPCDHCTPASKYSGAIVSFRPDGSNLELYASGIRAPVGLTYFPGTSDLFVTMDQRDDLGARTTGDALAVVRAASAWRSPDCYGQGGAACAGVPAATAVLDKHAAVSDVAIITGQLGPGVGTSAIVAEWALSKVERVVLQRTTAGYTAAVTTFLTGIQNPVAVSVSADGSLLVGDWASGTIYRVAPA